MKTFIYIYIPDHAIFENWGPGGVAPEPQLETPSRWELWQAISLSLEMILRRNK